MQREKRMRKKDVATQPKGNFMHVFTAFQCILEELTLLTITKVSTSKMHRTVVNACLTDMCRNETQS